MTIDEDDFTNSFFAECPLLSAIGTLQSQGIQLWLLRSGWRNWVQTKDGNLYPKPDG